MNRSTAKELLHIRDWLDRAHKLVEDGQAVYLADPLRQEAGDSLMMKIGEAANRLARADVVGPARVDWRDAIANRNWLIHQYDHIDRDVTWSTLAKDLSSWHSALASTFDVAATALESSFTAIESGVTAFVTR